MNAAKRFVWFRCDHCPYSVKAEPGASVVCPECGGSQFQTIAMPKPPGETVTRWISPDNGEDRVDAHPELRTAGRSVRGSCSSNQEGAPTRDTGPELLSVPVALNVPPSELAKSWWRCLGDGCSYTTEAISMEGQRCPKCRAYEWGGIPKREPPKSVPIVQQPKIYGKIMTKEQRGNLLAYLSVVRTRKTPQDRKLAEAIQAALTEIDWRRSRS